MRKAIRRKPATDHPGKLGYKSSESCWGMYSRYSLASRRIADKRQNGLLSLGLSPGKEGFSYPERRRSNYGSSYINRRCYVSPLNVSPRCVRWHRYKMWCPPCPSGYSFFCSYLLFWWLNVLLSTIKNSIKTRSSQVHLANSKLPTLKDQGDKAKLRIPLSSVNLRVSGVTA